jgi:DNA-3-methyladenine glycosylase I
VTEFRAFVGPDGAKRCWWSGSAPEFLDYHDREWGYPVADDRRLFEKIALESFQSGLSWRTIYNKRDAFRRAFCDFDFRRVACFGPEDVERLLGDASIVRHRGKIEATINNAARACELVDEIGSLAAFVWRYEPKAASRPERMSHEVVTQLVTAPESVQFAKDLKKRGWRFFGPTTAYAFMQAMGLVNDHTEDCVCRAKAETARSGFHVPT